MRAMTVYLMDADFCKVSHGIFVKDLETKRIYVNLYISRVTVAASYVFWSSFVSFSTVDELELAVIYQTLRSPPPEREISHDR